MLHCNIPQAFPTYIMTLFVVIDGFPTYIMTLFCVIDGFPTYIMAFFVIIDGFPTCHDIRGNWRFSHLYHDIICGNWRFQDNGRKELVLPFYDDQ